MSREYWRLVFTSGPSISKKSPLLLESFGLNEHLVEGRMFEIGHVRRERKLSVTGYFDVSCVLRPIYQGYPSDFDIILRDDYYFGFAFNLMIGPSKNSPVEREVGMKVGNFSAGGVVGVAP